MRLTISQVHMQYASVISVHGVLHGPVRYDTLSVTP
jgi:hypothetical protein